MIRLCFVGLLVWSMQGCINIGINLKEKNNNAPTCKQESTKATDWVVSWHNCSGDGAIKTDGTLWQLGKVAGCNWGQIHPVNLDTGEETKDNYIYHLEAKKIGDGFSRAKIINGGYRVYAIKKDGTLWGWGEGFRKKPMLLSQSHEWVDFGIKWEGNGCCAHDVGLKKDGTLWRFHEFFDYSKKSPLNGLKQVGNKKRWNKIILNCCTMYALKDDGSLWVNRSTSYHDKFVKLDKKVDCMTGDVSFCEKMNTIFKKMPSQTIYNYEDNKDNKINIGTRAGTLCVMPEVVYDYR